MTHCPECGYREDLPTFKHASTCSRIDLPTAIHYLKNAQRWQETASKKVGYFLREAQKWEGKFRIVCHENNQLRKKLK